MIEFRARRPKPAEPASATPTASTDFRRVDHLFRSK